MFIIPKSNNWAIDLPIFPTFHPDNNANSFIFSEIINY